MLLPAVSFADADKIFKENNKAVVVVVAYDEKNKPISQGSGFIVRQVGAIVTNYHVISNAKGIAVKAGDNDISIAIGRDKSTISREINRNRTPIYNVYLPHKAHERAKERKQKSGIRDRLKNPIIMTYVVNKLKLGWSPEQISGRLLEICCQ